jgi:hypothetical protein
VASFAVALVTRPYSSSPLLDLEQDKIKKLIQKCLLHPLHRRLHDFKTLISKSRVTLPYLVLW